MIYEVIISTMNDDQSVHIAPMGITEQAGLILIKPFKPSTTLDNLQRHQQAVINYIDDVAIFAGCLTQQQNHHLSTNELSFSDQQNNALQSYHLISCEHITGYRLSQALSHTELKVTRYEDDKLRPIFYCEVVHQANHAMFKGFNRAQTAILEICILASRLNRLPKQTIDDNIHYLRAAIDKTAGKQERLAWDWLMAKINDYYTVAKQHDQ